MKLPSLSCSALLAGFVLMLANCAAAPAAAETLAQALALAYQSNPTLQSKRAQQRALDETYVQARAGWLPSVNISGQANWARTDLGSTQGSELVPNGLGGYTVQGVGSGGHYETNYGTASLNATQPIYTGGRTAAAVSAAEATVLAGRESLRSVESQVLQSVITTYEDVRRDREVLEIRAFNAGVLRSQLEETRAKFIAGQVTRTDVAQAEAQLASAESLRAIAKAQVLISSADYAAVVGQDPGQLAPEPSLPGLPASVEQAFDTAAAENPGLRETEIMEQASRARIAGAKAANRPALSAQVSLGYDGSIVPLGVANYDRNLSGQLVLTQPLFTGGVNASAVRQAIEQNTADRISIETTRRAVVRAVSQAWNTTTGCRASVLSDVEQVRAAQIAFDGVREQYKVGLSTTLEVLIQQQSLEAAQLLLVQARHDAYVAEAALLSAMGRLEAAALIQGLPLYDPAKAFRHVKNIGLVPWEPLVEALDSISAPRMIKPALISASPTPSDPASMAPP